MRLDTDDLDSLETQGLLGDVILHEMGHVIGFGTLWDTKGLLEGAIGSGGSDPHFVGADALWPSTTRAARRIPPAQRFRWRTWGNQGR